MNYFRLLLSLFLAGALSSCVSNFKVSADYDKQVDFSTYSTFSLLPWDDDVSSHISNEAKTLLYSAARSEMEKRGYTYVEKGGDLTLGISVLIEEKVEYRADGTVNYNVGFGTYGYYGGYGMGYSSPTTIKEYYYNDGSLIIDVFDEKKKTLIWQGFGFDRLEDNAHKNVEKIETYMKYIFYKYPLKPSKKK
jgi:hypothetical protein